MRPFLFFILFAPALLRAQAITNSAHFFTLHDSVFHYNDIYRTDSIEWDFDAVQLLPKSYPLLDSIANFMLRHPQLTIEIGCNTDSRGSDSFNKSLTLMRANDIFYYFINKHNVPKENMVVWGYGETNPLYSDDFIGKSNDPEKYHQLNRRTEFRILATKRIMNPAPRFNPLDTSFTPGSYDLEFIQFLPGRSAIDSSATELEVYYNIAGFLKHHPAVVMEVGAHLDSRGSVEYDNILSQQRAQSVVNYLIRLGVPKSQLVTKGYEDVVPIIPNTQIAMATQKIDKEKLHAINRRTEFKIISMQ
ncbi:MAG TPA: OmpA family protein [Bacteroidia bacterium]|jgi:outer membrane protein OmpA-like peptidoglycan-associated protein|nr:OmpA family protein [Bacteroidia bacterium]